MTSVENFSLSQGHARPWNNMNKGGSRRIRRRKAVTNNVSQTFPLATINQSAFHPSKPAQPKQQAHLPYTNKRSSKSGVYPQEILPPRKLLLSVLAKRHSHHLQTYKHGYNGFFFLDFRVCVQPADGTAPLVLPHIWTARYLDPEKGIGKSDPALEGGKEV